MSGYSFLLPSPLNLLCPRVRPCECGCIHEDPLFPIQPGGFNSSADGATVDAWPYFPGLKVGINDIYSPLLGYLVPLIINRYLIGCRVRLNIIELGGLTVEVLC
jgi:hypothetical protein